MVMLEVPMWRTSPRWTSSSKLAPGAHVALVNVGDGVGVAGADIAMRRMMVGKRPVNEIEVEIVELEVTKRLLAGGDYVLFSVLVVPELGRDPELFTLDAGTHDELKRLTDQVFVAVDGGAVEVAIAERGGVRNCGGNRGMRNVVGAEGTEANGGHECAGAKAALRNAGGVDGIGSGKHEVG
jgi:hypothetical protein